MLQCYRIDRPIHTSDFSPLKTLSHQLLFFKSFFKLDFSGFGECFLVLYFIIFTFIFFHLSSFPLMFVTRH